MIAPNSAARRALQEPEQPLAGILGDGSSSSSARDSGVTVTSMNGTCATLVDESQRLIAERRRSVRPTHSATRSTMVLIWTTARNTNSPNGTITDREGRQQRQGGRQALAEPLVDPVVQRGEQVRGHRGHHDENEVAAQEVGAEEERR